MGDTKNEATAGCLSVVLAILLLWGAVSFFMNLGGDKREPTVQEQLLPEVVTWLKEHPIGEPRIVSDMSDWANGKRQAVTIKGNAEIDDYLFYTQDGRVVTVYKYNAYTTEEKELVWKQ